MENDLFKEIQSKVYIGNQCMCSLEEITKCIKDYEHEGL